MADRHANRAPVIVLRHVDHCDIAADAIRMPVRLVDLDGAAVGDLRDHGDVPEAHPGIGAEVQHAADFRRGAAGVDAFGILPPICRIAGQGDIRGGAGERHALDHMRPCGGECVMQSVVAMVTGRLCGGGSGKDAGGGCHDCANKSREPHTPHHSVPHSVVKGE